MLGERNYSEAFIRSGSGLENDEVNTSLGRGRGQPERVRSALKRFDLGEGEKRKPMGLTFSLRWGMFCNGVQSTRIQ